MINLDILLVRAFLAVVEERSLTGAGQRLHRTQSTVSIQLKRLEDLLGERLVHRKQGRISGLTEAGQRFLEPARRFVRIHDETVATLRNSSLTGHIYIGIADETAHEHIAQALAAFRAHHPHVHLEVISKLSTELEQLVSDGELDLALVNRDPTDSRPGEELYREELSWVASRGLVWDETEPVPLAGFPPACPYRKRTVTALERADIPLVDIFTSSTHEGIWNAVTAGLGVAALPKSLLATKFLEQIYTPNLPEVGAIVGVMVGSDRTWEEPLVTLASYIRSLSRTVEGSAQAWPAGA
ncbi:MAG: LysR family transcriptional regulator [Pseudomonadota bacterium]